MPPRATALAARRKLRQTPRVSLTRNQIVAALERLDQRLGEAGCRASIYLVGGAVMCLVLNARETTRDVDAWFSDPRVVRAAAAGVAADLDLPEDWLNDAAKAYLPAEAGYETWRCLANLEILVADEATLFAMKCAAARTDQDASDIRLLAARLHLTSSAQALEVVLRYFPAERLPVRTRLLLEELLDDGA